MPRFPLNDEVSTLTALSPQRGARVCSLLTSFLSLTLCTGPDTQQELNKYIWKQQTTEGRDGNEPGGASGCASASRSPVSSTEYQQGFGFIWKCWYNFSFWILKACICTHVCMYTCVHIHVCVCLSLPVCKCTMFAQFL